MNNRPPFDNGYQPTEDYPEYIDHYFYFPQSSDAERAAVRLRARGWSTEVKLGADGVNWLALASRDRRNRRHRRDRARSAAKPTSALSPGVPSYAPPMLGWESPVTGAEGSLPERDSVAVWSAAIGNKDRVIG